MAGRAAQSQTITEADDGLEELPQGGGQNDNALGAAALEALTPPQAPIIHPARADAPREEFDVLEVDDSGDPLEGGYQDVVEEPLTEDAAGQRSVIESPEQTAEREKRGGQVFRTRAEKRQAQRRARDRSFAEQAALRNENAQLRQRFDELQQYVTQTVDPRLVELGNARLQGQVQSFDQAIAAEAGKLATAQHRMSEAMAAQDGNVFAAALTERDNALVTKARLEVRREGLVQAINQQQQNGGQQQDNRQVVSRETAQPRQQVQPQGQAGPDIGPAAQAYMQDFVSAFPDFKADGNDRESRIVRRLDQEVMQEGYDPNSIEYWDELERRVETNIPDWAAPAQQQPAQRRQTQPRAQQQQQAQPQNATRRGPMVAGGQDAQPRTQGGRVTVQITPARKAAMIAAGSLSDDGTITNDKKFKAQLAQYAAFDRANPNGAGR